MNNIKRCWIVGLVSICCNVSNRRGVHRHFTSALVINTNKFHPSSSSSSCTRLEFSSFDIDIPSSKESDSNYERDPLNIENSNLLIWEDILPISLFTTICLVGAVIVSTYEDYDVTHVRPSPSTLRQPTDYATIRSSDDIDSSSSSSPIVGNNKFNFIGAATKGMGAGKADRLASTFDDWYGTSATTLQDVRGYNEIMLEHRRSTIPKWIGQKEDTNDLGLLGSDTASRISYTVTKESKSYPKEELQEAVLQLYNSLDELDKLKTMSDDYMWDEVKDMLRPLSRGSGNVNTLRQTFESLDVLKTAPLYYKSIANNNNQFQHKTLGGLNNVDQLPELIGFDWGSCAWRHCGAKADAQEALAELYTSVGMLEPFECRFIIDIIERSIRDVLLVVPDELRPLSSDGTVLELKPYEPYVSQAELAGEDESMGIDVEYVNALNSLREEID